MTAYIVPCVASSSGTLFIEYQPKHTIEACIGDAGLDPQICPEDLYEICVFRKRWTKRSERKVMKKILLAAIFFLGSVSMSWATPISFIYDSTTDASFVGGSTAESVSITFTFDSNLLNGTGNFGTSATNGSYGPWMGVLRIGTETLVLEGGTIEVFNDAGYTVKNDGYEFRWDRARGTSTGSLFGETLDFFRVLIVDEDLDMLSSTALPTDPSFALRGDYIQDSYLLSSGRSFGLSESAPGRSFSLSSASPVPEPAAIWLFGSGLLGLIRFRKARRGPFRRHAGTR